MKTYILQSTITGKVLGDVVQMLPMVAGKRNAQRRKIGAEYRYVLVANLTPSRVGEPLKVYNVEAD